MIGVIAQHEKATTIRTLSALQAFDVNGTVHVSRLDYLSAEFECYLS